MDEGRVAEFDVPYLLLQRRDSQFRKLVEQTGKSETMQLLDIAKKAYENMKSGRNQGVIPEEIKPEISDLVEDTSESKSNSSDFGGKKSVDLERSDSIDKDEDASKGDDQQQQEEVSRKSEDALTDAENDQKDMQADIDHEEGISNDEQDSEKSGLLLEKQDDSCEDKTVTTKSDDTEKPDVEDTNEDVNDEEREVVEEADEIQESQALLKKDS